MTKKLAGLSIAAAVCASLALSAASASAVSAGVGSNDGCPSEHLEAREMVITFLDAPAFSQDATALGFAPGDTLGLRLLTAPADSAACERLQNGLATGDVSGHPYLHSFYQLEDHYLIGIGVDPDAISQLNPDGTISVHIRKSYVAVVDSAFQVVGSFGL